MSPKYPKWLNSVRVGDVLKSGSGDLRIVRRVTRYPKDYCSKNAGLVRGVAFAIRRCSWTTRCYTTIGFVALAQLGYQPTGVRMKLTSTIDKKIARDLVDENRFNQKTNCCDVEGIA